MHLMLLAYKLGYIDIVSSALGGRWALKSAKIVLILLLLLIFIILLLSLLLSSSSSLLLLSLALLLLSLLSFLSLYHYYDKLKNYWLFLFFIFIVSFPF